MVGWVQTELSPTGNLITYEKGTTREHIAIWIIIKYPRVVIMMVATPSQQSVCDFEAG